MKKKLFIIIPIIVVIILITVLTFFYLNNLNSQKAENVLKQYFSLLKEKNYVIYKRWKDRVLYRV